MTDTSYLPDTPELENQPDELPTHKLLVGVPLGSIATLLTYYGMEMALPPEVMNAWIALGAWVVGMIVGFIASWPVRDRLGEPLAEEDE